MLKDECYYLYKRLSPTVPMTLLGPVINPLSEVRQPRIPTDRSPTTSYGLCHRQRCPILGSLVSELARHTPLLVVGQPLVNWIV